MTQIVRVLILLFLFSNQLLGQNKRAITHDDYDGWKSIRSAKISNNGKWVIYSETPQEGDALLKIHRSNGQLLMAIERAKQPQISEDAKFAFFKIAPPLDSVKALKRKKVKKAKLPKDTLGILQLATRQLIKIPRLKSYKIPAKANGWIAYQTEKALPQKTEKKTKKAQKKSKKKKKAKIESQKNGYKLILRNLTTAREDSFYFVQTYSFTENGRWLAFFSTGKDSIFEGGVYVYNTKQNTLNQLLATGGSVKNLTWDEAGQQLAFVADIDTSKTHKNALQKYYSLYYWKTGNQNAMVVADTNSTALPNNWVVNEFEKLIFSKDGSKLFFGTNPKPLLPDTTLLPEEKVQVDIWSWTDGQLQPHQLANQKRDKKRAYQAVLHTKNKKMVQLGSPNVPTIKLGNEGNADLALGLSNIAYQKNVSWEGFPYNKDVYLIDLNTGQRQFIKRAVRGNIDFSPSAKYLFWYEVTDSSWYSYSIKTKQLYNLTQKVPTPFYQEEHDMPSHPYSYDMAGWTKNDKAILLYDRYDIWSIDPTNKKTAKRLTNGRSDKTRHRNIQLDAEVRFINPKQDLLLHVHNETTRAEGFAQFNIQRDTTPQILIMDDYRFFFRGKAKNANKLLFAKGNFQTYPNIWYTATDFNQPKKLSDANPQQQELLWGSVETTTWKSLDGRKIKGLIYKPENFDPNKKYPMLVYFYEKYSHRLHRYYSPAPLRSAANFTYLVSNGYVVFVPDIHYKDGFPGQSAYNCVIPGVSHMINKGYINKYKVGVQGHSWGGYQGAYLITKTNIFAACESGAPVSNMTSAYGGIRWRSGLSRMFQYEHTQSRIGGTLWEKPMHYIKNSPLFRADKIKTPVLILHNDKDGAVPWYQGIELFVALRRLNKPAWLLNYNGEGHGISKRQNRKDFSKRMYQFFDHYLKGAPAPEWMLRGIPAVEKGLNDGLQLIHPLDQGSKK